MQRYLKSALGTLSVFATIALLLIALPFVMWPAFTDGMVWEVRHAGAATNGGGVASGVGTDMSIFDNKNATSCTSCQSATINISTTDAVANGTTTITSATANFSSAITKNVVYITGGTGSITAARYVATFVNSTTITTDRSTGLTTGTGVTINIGGAIPFANLSAAMSTTNNIQQTAWVKADATYTSAANISIAPTCTAGTNGCSIQINGYTSTRGDNGKFTVQSTNSAASTLVSVDNNGSLSNLIIRNMLIDCNAFSSVGFGLAASGNSGENIEAKNCLSYGIWISGSSGSSQTMCRNCWSHNNPGTSGASGGFLIGNGGEMTWCIWCVATANGATGTNQAVGFNLAGGVTCIHCIAGNNTGSTGTNKNSGFLISSLGRSVVLDQCVVYGNSQDGIQINVNSTFPVTVTNCLIVNNTVTGFNSINTTYIAGSQWFDYNGYFGNGTARVGNSAGPHDVTLTGDPFTNGAGNVFTLNNTAGAGASARAAGFPGAMLAGGTGYLDIGVMQHQSTAAATASPIIQ